MIAPISFGGQRKRSVPGGDRGDENYLSQTIDIFDDFENITTAPDDSSIFLARNKNEADLWLATF